jgi:hypothetical protein
MGSLQRRFPLTLPILYDGERVGQVTLTGQRAYPPILLGNFFPDPAFAKKTLLFTEARRRWEAIMSATSEAEKDQAIDRWHETGRELARHIRLSGLPLEWEEFSFDEFCVSLRVKVRDPVEYAYRHPPRCIRELNPVQLTEMVPGMATYNFVAYFRVGCPCGERATYLLGYFMEDKGPGRVRVFVSPLALECPACGRVSELIDTQQHGFGGENDCDCNMTGEGPRTWFPCPQCGEVPLAVIPGFSYQGDDDPFDIRERPQDFFGAFWVCGECSQCGQLLTITGFESA